MGERADFMRKESENFNTEFLIAYFSYWYEKITDVY